MMGSFSAIHWVMVLGVVVLLFGAGKLPKLMGDFAKGIKVFKSEMKDDEATPPARQITPS
jgi:sec-independent protein translocase protein TatA